MVKHVTCLGRAFGTGMHCMYVAHFAEQSFFGHISKTFLQLSANLLCHERVFVISKKWNNDIASHPIDSSWATSFPKNNFTATLV